MPNSAFGLASRSNSSRQRARPAQAQLHRGARLALGRDVALGLVRRAFVELHDDVAVEHALDLHAHLGREEELVAVDGRGELDALFADLAHLAERPDLEAAAVGEDRPRPALEAVQAAELAQHVEPRAQPQVEGVAEDDLRAHVLERTRHHALDGAVGPHRHEDRRLDHAVVERQAAAAGLAFGLQHLELQAARNRGCRGGPVGRKGLVHARDCRSEFATARAAAACAHGTRLVARVGANPPAAASGDVDQEDLHRHAGLRGAHRPLMPMKFLPFHQQQSIRARAHAGEGHREPAELNDKGTSGTASSVKRRR